MINPSISRSSRLCQLCACSKVNRRPGDKREVAYQSSELVLSLQYARGNCLQSLWVVNVDRVFVVPLLDIQKSEPSAFVIVIQQIVKQLGVGGVDDFIEVDQRH
jgi:hypothetical protein